MIQEFKDFIMRGNVLDLAVAVVIGAAFSAIVSSMVDDLINPIIGLLIGGLDFSNLFVALDGNTYPTIEAAQEAGAGVLAIGNFILAIINFLIVAFVLFLIIKAYNSTQQKPEEAPEPEPEPEPDATEKLIEVLERIEQKL